MLPFRLVYGALNEGFQLEMYVNCPYAFHFSFSMSCKPLFASSCMKLNCSLGRGAGEPFCAPASEDASRRPVSTGRMNLAIPNPLTRLDGPRLRPQIPHQGAGEKAGRRVRQFVRNAGFIDERPKSHPTSAAK